MAQGTVLCGGREETESDSAVFQNDHYCGHLRQIQFFRHSTCIVGLCRQTISWRHCVEILHLVQHLILPAERRHLEIGKHGGSERLHSSHQHIKVQCSLFFAKFHSNISTLFV